jgi:hypothetical protein
MTRQAVAEARWIQQSALTARSRLYVIAAGTAALAFGVLLPIAPRTVAGVLAAVLLAFGAPVAALASVLAITVMVPWDLQDTLKVIGGPGERGLCFVDALIMLGLMRLGWLVVRRRLDIDLPLVMGTMVTAACAAEAVWGIALGAPVSDSGTELRRAILGVGTFLLAWPLMADRSARRRLAGALIGIGLVVGLWGLAQWVFRMDFTFSGDIGVRHGLGAGQLQGGMYAYPVVVALAWAALVVGQVRNVAVKCLLALILFLNACCLLLTFERTFWGATAVACAFVIVTSGVRARPFAIRWAGIGVALLVGATVMASAAGGTALERLGSVGHADNDLSLKARLAQSQTVAKVITARPVTGSGFGANITWGIPDRIATSTTPFVDPGYVWLVWKIGIPAAAIIVLLLGRAVLRRSPSEETAQWHALRKGSQASLLALLIICVTFAVFDALGITAAMGLLVAVCYSGADSAAVPVPLPGQGHPRSRCGVATARAGIAAESCKDPTNPLEMNAMQHEPGSPAIHARRIVSGRVISGESR